MSNRFFYHKTFFVQAAILCGCLFVSGCENDPHEVNAWNMNHITVEEATEVVSMISEQGILKAKLTAPLMRRYQTDTIYLEFPNKLHVNFYDSAGRVESQLDARYGKYFESLNKVYLRDNIVASNVQGDTLRCPELWWDQNTKKFYTDKTVRILTVDKRIIGGRGFEAEQDLSSYKIFQPTGTLVVPEEMAP